MLNKSGDRKYLFKIITVIFVVFFIIAILIKTRPETTVELQAAVVQVVDSEKVIRMDVKPYERVVGRLQPVRKTVLSFEVEGVVISKMVNAGDEVEVGTVLLQLDAADYKNKLNEMESAYLQELAAVRRDRKLLDLSINNVDLSLNEVKRLRNLGEKSLSSKTVLDQAKQRLSQARSEQANLQYQVDTSEQRLITRQSQKEKALRNVSRTELLAPYQGRVNAVHVESGDRITPNKVVVDFIDDSIFEVRIQVSQKAVAQLYDGMDLKVNIGDQLYPGKVISFQLDPDPQTYTYEARIRINSDAVLSGMLAEIELPLKPALNAKVVPLSAVLLDDGETSLFVIQADESGRNKLIKKKIKLGIRYKSWQVIKEGIEENDLIVARDVSALSDQQVVTVQ